MAALKQLRPDVAHHPPKGETIDEIPPEGPKPGVRPQGIEPEKGALPIPKTGIPMKGEAGKISIPKTGIPPPKPVEEKVEEPKVTVHVHAPPGVLVEVYFHNEEKKVEEVS